MYVNKVLGYVRRGLDIYYDPTLDVGTRRVFNR